ncbi:MAG: isoprenyl transferase [Bacteroidales bacterium]|nr:isoprenyl transferase [Bacteroidales bacterium]
MGTKKILQHVAIIMDGNGRWAKKQGLSRIAGHTKGAETVKTIVKTAIKNKIQYLTLFAFSTENWNRPENEIKGLMNLLVERMHSEREEFTSRGIKLRILGDLSKFPKHIQEMINKLQEETAQNSTLVLNIALNYGGRCEIVRAAREISRQVLDGKITLDHIDEKLFSRFLYTNDIPDPDLLIRTSGELRISNFLLWQLAYTELYFTPVLWPDFDETEFEKALADYYSRERRFGKISEQIQHDE